MKISIFGLGYVGVVSAGCLSKDGHEVIGVDPNQTKVDLINGGNSPIVEQDIGDIIRTAVSTGQLKATTSASEAVARSEVSLVCVGTPSNANGSLDLRYVQSVCEELGHAIGQKSGRHSVVMRSTMLPGTMRDVVIPRLEEHSGMKASEDFSVCNNPEFLREGTAVFDYYNPPKTVIGELQPGDGDEIATIYSDLTAPLIRTDVDTAEMVKYVDNVWHALKVGFANEIGSICKSLDLDGQGIMDIFCRDEKLNISSYYLRPGFAFGGSCLPKDVRALNYKAMRLDVDVPILKSVLPSNQLQVERGIKLIEDSGSKNVGILGFSFKAGTDDLRESPIIRMIEYLIGKGFDLCIYDKNVNVSRLVGANKDYINSRIPHIASIMVNSLEEVLKRADTVVIGNGSSEFRNIIDRVGADQQVVDLVGVAKPAGAAANYQGIGW